MTITVPGTLPAAYVTNAGQTQAPPEDTGGYDILIGDLGFRLATSTQFPYSRKSDPYTAQRVDTSAQPGEQTLTPLPWVKQQSSFHGGAGQLNLETVDTKTDLSHLRFDGSRNVDCWTPGKVTRLPDVTITALSVTGECMTVGTVDDVDYAIVGGDGGLLQVAWTDGVDETPTVTAIDLAVDAFTDAANCEITSLTSDGKHYYALIQLTALAGSATCLTYVVKGALDSTDTPTILYPVPNGASSVVRTNLCLNPSFETDTTGWSDGASGATLASSTDYAKYGSDSMLITWGSDATADAECALIDFDTVEGAQYILSAWVWRPTGGTETDPAEVVIAGATPNFLASAAFTSDPVTARDTWTRLSTTFVASGTTSQFTVRKHTHSTTKDDGTCYVDGVLVEKGSTLADFFDGDTTDTDTITYAWSGTSGDSTSTASTAAAATQVAGVLGWVKARLMAALGASVYELDATADQATLPSDLYTSPNGDWAWTSIGEAPQAVLVAGSANKHSQVLQLVLDTSVAAPTLGGGAAVATLPLGEVVESMRLLLGSFLILGTSKGVRVAVFDAYTGAVQYGPLTAATDSAVKCVTGRGDFAYAGYTNGNENGDTGLLRVSLGMQVDSAGRLAWAPDILPPSTASTGVGVVSAVEVLPSAQRLVFLAPDGLHYEGGVAGSDGDAWLRTSRIRYGTSENKLFRSARVRGDFTDSQVKLTAATQYGPTLNLGKYGNLTTEPPEVGIPDTVAEWLQLTIALLDADCGVSAWHVKALPVSARQDVITLTVLDMRTEVDRFNLRDVDPQIPRARLSALRDLERAGDAVRLAEFTPLGPVVSTVVVQNVSYLSVNRPTKVDDFNGYITVELRDVSDA